MWEIVLCLDRGLQPEKTLVEQARLNQGLGSEVPTHDTHLCPRSFPSPGFLRLRRGRVRGFCSRDGLSISFIRWARIAYVWRGLFVSLFILRCDRVSSDSDHEGANVPLGHNNRSGQRPRRHALPGIDCSRIQQTESREVGAGCKQRSIDLRDNDRGVTSFGVCARDEVGSHLAIVEASLRGLTAGVPRLLGKCDKETLGPDGEQGILMAGWSGVEV